MPRPYKGTSFQRTIQQKYAQPRHQLSDRDQEAQSHLKAKATKLQYTSHSDTHKPTADPPPPQNNGLGNINTQQPQDPTSRDSQSVNISEFHSMKA